MTRLGDVGAVTELDVRNEMSNIRLALRVRSDADSNARLGLTMDYLGGLFNEDLYMRVCEGTLTSEQAKVRKFVRKSAIEASGLYELGIAMGAVPIGEYLKAADQLVQPDFFDKF